MDADLWGTAPPSSGRFEAAQTIGLPDAAQRYLQHAIALGTPLASAVQLKTHGEINLKGWHPFKAEEVISRSRGMTWRATIKLHGISIRGGDSFIDGRATMLWKLFGIIPMVNASGPDISRSTAGRVNLESIWLPSALCSPEVTWAALDSGHCHARFTAHNETAEIDFSIDDAGRLQAVNMPRWGNPDGGEFGYFNCGGFVEQEGSFGGYTIPTRMRVGWNFGTGEFERKGEFIRVTIDEAEYR
jgi:hypothetical protein